MYVSVTVLYKSLWSDTPKDTWPATDWELEEGDNPTACAEAKERKHKSYVGMEA